MPALGMPTMPTSDKSFSSSLNQRSSPGSPFSANPGAWRLEVTKRAFPLPPEPPLATRHWTPAAARSASGSAVWSSRTTVPTGTLMVRSRPLRPCFLFPEPWEPFPARKWTRRTNSMRVRCFESATIWMWPPLPPSPPSGPPRGANFSRRKLTLPFPPSPARTKILASSTSPGRAGKARRGLCARGFPRGAAAPAAGSPPDASALARPAAAPGEKLPAAG